MSTNVLSAFNYLDGMRKGCSKVIQLLDDFKYFISNISVPNDITIPCLWSLTPLLYKDYYAKRKAVYLGVMGYLDTYFTEGDNVTKYDKAAATLNSVLDFFNVLINTKSPDIYNKSFKTNTISLINAWQKDLALNLRDPLIEETITLASSSTAGSRSGSRVNPTNYPTTNVVAEGYYNAAKVRVIDPVIKNNVSGTRSEDINKLAEENLKFKQHESVEQDDILRKLASGSYLFDAVNKFSETAKNWLGKSNVGNFVLNNLICNDTMVLASSKPLTDEKAKEARERTRQKFGGKLGFCDEIPDGKGGWVLKSEADAKVKLEKARFEMRNKMLTKI